jgi:hypothetical protein
VTAHFYGDRLAIRPIEPTFGFDFGALTQAGHPQTSAAHRFRDMVAAAIPAASVLPGPARSVRPKKRHRS